MGNQAFAQQSPEFVRFKSSSSAYQANPQQPQQQDQQQQKPQENEPRRKSQSENLNSSQEQKDEWKSPKHIQEISLQNTLFDFPTNNLNP